MVSGSMVLNTLLLLPLSFWGYLPSLSCLSGLPSRAFTGGRAGFVRFLIDIVPLGADHRLRISRLFATARTHLTGAGICSLPGYMAMLNILPWRTKLYRHCAARCCSRLWLARIRALTPRCLRLPCREGTTLAVRSSRLLKAATTQLYLVWITQGMRVLRPA